MDSNENKEINDVLGKLRASMENPEKSSGKSSNNDRFDREIAAMIEERLNSGENAADKKAGGNLSGQAETGREDSDSSFYSDEIILDDFVTEDTEKTEKAEATEKEEKEEKEEDGANGGTEKAERTAYAGKNEDVGPVVGNVVKNVKADETEAADVIEDSTETDETDETDEMEDRDKKEETISEMPAAVAEALNDAFVVQIENESETEFVSSEIEQGEKAAFVPSAEIKREEETESDRAGDLEEPFRDEETETAQKAECDVSNCEKAETAEEAETVNKEKTAEQTEHDAKDYGQTETISERGENMANCITDENISAENACDLLNREQFESDNRHDSKIRPCETVSADAVSNEKNVPVADEISVVENTSVDDETQNSENISVDNEIQNGETPSADIETRDDENVFAYDETRGVENKSGSLSKTDGQYDDASEVRQMKEKDIEMLLALSRESDLGERIGFEKLDEYKKNLRNKQKQTPSEPEIPEAWAFRGVEYRSHSQDTQIKSDYKKCRISAIIRLIFSLIICGICGVMENAKYFGFLLIRPFEPTDTTPLVYVLTLCGLLLASALLSWRPLKNGLFSIFRFDPESHSIASVSFIICLIHDIVMLIAMPDNMMLYNFPVTFCISLTIVQELIVICREKNSFDVISSGDIRYAPEREARMFEEKYNSRENSSSDGIYRRVYDIVASHFTDGYFRHTNEKKKGVYILNFILLPSLAVGLVEFIISLSAKAGVTYALVSFAFTVTMTLPAPMIIALVIPPLSASIRLKRRGCAILGDSSVDEFSHSKLFVFDDCTMFPPDRIGTKGIKIYDGFELYDVLVKTGSLFAYIGGPLGKLFEAENSQYHRIKNINLVKVERGGVEATLDGKTNIIAGNIGFMEKYGINIERSPRDEQLISEGVISVIYIALERKPAARLYADYRTDDAFEHGISMMRKGSDAVAIRTSDPGIDENIISRKRTYTEYELSVIRPGYVKDTRERDALDAGIVSTESPQSLVEVANECHKLRKNRHISMLLYFCVFMINVIVATVLVTMKLILSVPSGLIVLYAAVWILPVLFMLGAPAGDRK